MRILFIGDIVGRSGRAIVLERLPRLVRDWRLDCVVINGENAAGGFGITEAIYQDLLDAGADAVTLGNHAWDQKEALVFIERAPRLIRPDQLSGRNARARRRPDRDQERRACAGDQCHGPHLHGPARRSVRGGRARAGRASARRDRGRHHHRHARRSHQREAGDGPFLRRPRQPGGRHPYPRADRRPSGSAGRHRLHVGRRHDRRLQFGHRHGQGRAAQPVPAPHFHQPLRAGARRGDPVRGGGRDRRCDRPRAGASPAVRLGGRLEQARPAFWE